MQIRKKIATVCFITALVSLCAGPVLGAGSNDYIAVINTNGEDASSTQSSGTLPGASPLLATGPLYRSDGRIIPLRKDRMLPRLDPSLAREAREEVEAGQGLFTMQAIQAAASIGDQKSFWVQDTLDPSWRQVAATVQATGNRCVLWIDDTLTVPSSSISLYVNEFDVMYDVVGDNIGSFVDRDSDGKVAILLYAMNDGGSISGYTGGYFWSKDYYLDSQTSPQGIRSNEMDIVYIRGDEPSGWDSVGDDFYEYNLTTLVHEYQHLMHFGIKVWDNNGDYTDTWIDEMMAMASETMYFKEKLDNNPSYTHSDMQGDGFLASRIAYYSQDLNSSIKNGHGLTFWDNYGDVLANYALSYLFGQYLAAQASSGQGIFKDILNYMLTNGLNDYRAVAGIAQSRLSGVSSWEDLLKNWAIANFLNLSSGPYGYGGAFSLTAQGPTSSKINISNGGVVYREVGGAWSAPSDAGSAIEVYGFDDDGAAGTTTTTAGSTTTTTVAETTTTSTSVLVTTTTSVLVTTTTSVLVTTTTTSTPAGPCPASLLFGRKGSETEQLRLFRDAVLQDSEAGKGLVKLYYRHSIELSRLMGQYPELRSRIIALINELLPDLTAAVETYELSVPERSMETLLDLCDDIAAVAGPGLQASVERLKGKYTTGELLIDLGISPVY